MFESDASGNLPKWTTLSCFMAAPCCHVARVCFVFRVECERGGEVKLAGNRGSMFSAPARPLHPTFQGLEAVSA
jgi:hypothetical protein